MAAAGTAVAAASDARQIPFLLVGNKADLEDMRQVDSMRGQEMAAKYDCQFLETSAKTNTNVSEAFETLVRAVISQKGGSSSAASSTDTKKSKGGKCILL